MSLYLLSLVAWILTVLAPCVLPILPIIIWWSVIDGKKSRPWVIIAAFAVSVILITLWLQFLVSQFGISQRNLTVVSAVILIFFGLMLLIPKLRNLVMHKTGIEGATNKAQWSTTWWFGGDILLWFILWPIFNTCSPTYAILVWNVLPANFSEGMIHILLYVAWLSAVLLAIAYGWRALVNKLKWASDPKGWFKKIIAVILIVMWVAIIMKWDKQVEGYLVENGLFYDTSGREVDIIKEEKKNGNLD